MGTLGRARFVYHSRWSTPISDFESQIERLHLALQRWQQAEQQIQPLEDRLSALTERGSEIVDRLAAADERQAHAVSEVEARLSEWHATERRLHQDSLERMRTLERTIEQEWRALRGMHEEPLRFLREQAAALGETSVAAASLSLRGYERAEARLSALESDLRAQLAQLSRDIHQALAEVKAAAVAAPAALPPPAAAPFPLDRVMRIHDELRETDGPSGGPREPSSPARGEAAEPISASVVPPRPDAAAAAGSAGAGTSTASGTTASARAPVTPIPAVADEARQLPAASALSQRMEELERELTHEKQEIEEAAATTRQLRRGWRVAVAAALIGAAGLGMMGWQVKRALDDAAARAAVAERQAAERDREIASARAETVAARDAAARAELLSSVLAAPDLLRFNLAGVGQASASRGQVMWSRSTGLVLSTSTLAPPPSGAEYHVWLLTPGQPIHAGTLSPDPSGRATLATSTPDVPRPIDGVAVTLEAAGSSPRVPVGLTVLTRAPAAEP